VVTVIKVIGLLRCQVPAAARAGGGATVRGENRVEQAVVVARKTLRRPVTGRAGLNGGAPRSEDARPEQRFSGLRNPVLEANGRATVDTREYA
jgi:hypothetical protein